MRGKAVEMKLAGTVHGITPAYAGKRQMWSMLLASARDHPRVCGEKYGVEVDFKNKKGSPPRVRGKVYQTRIQCGV